MKTFICPTCNKGEVREVARAGRRLHFRTIPNLEVPSDVLIPTCTHSGCGEEWLDSATAARLDEAMKGAYQAALTMKAEEAISRLKKRAPQRDLERLLGLSAGYLSKLKHGKETTAPLVAALMLLASDPHRVDELRALWLMQPPQESTQVRLSSSGEVTFRHSNKARHARLVPARVEGQGVDVTLEGEVDSPEVHLSQSELAA